MSETTPTAVAVVTLDTPELQALEPSKAEQIRATFVPMADMLAEFEADFAEVTSAAQEEVTPEVSARARRLRLDIARVRIAAEKARVAIKAEYLAASKAIDGTNNILKWAIHEKEAVLEDIEKHAERMEAERLRALQAEREDALAPYMSIEDLAGRDLASMEPDVWDAYLAAKKKDHEDRVAAERKAEEERIERERIARLQAERRAELAPYFDFVDREAYDTVALLEPDAYAALLEDARTAKAEWQAEAERARAEAERLAKEAERKEKARLAELARIEKEREKERKRIEAERKKEREAAEAERKRREELEAKEAERKAAEEAARKERERAAREAAKAPTRKRLAAWVDAFELPDLPGEEHPTADEIRDSFAGFCAWARKEVDAL